MDIGPFWASLQKNLKAKPILNAIGLDEEGECIREVSFGYVWYNSANWVFYFSCRLSNCFKQNLVDDFKNKSFFQFRQTQKMK